VVDLAGRGWQNSSVMSLRTTLCLRQIWLRFR